VCFPAAIKAADVLHACSKGYLTSVKPQTDTRRAKGRVEEPFPVDEEEARRRKGGRFIQCRLQLSMWTLDARRRRRMSACSLSLCIPETPL